MANWSSLKAAIAEVVKTNGNQEITGANMQSVLNNIVNSVGENATFAGIATPSTNPGVPDGRIFYIATEKGVYANFGGNELQAGISILLYRSNTWEIYQCLNISQELGDDENAMVSQKTITEELTELSRKNLNFLVFKEPKNISQVTDYIANTIIENDTLLTDDGFSTFRTLHVDNISGSNDLYLWANFEKYGIDVFGTHKNILIKDAQEHIYKSDVLVGKCSVVIPVGYEGYFTFKVANKEVYYVQNFYENTKQEGINRILYANSFVQNIHTYPIYDKNVDFPNNGKILLANGELLDNADYKTSDYIISTESIQAIYTRLNGFAETLSNVCYYTDDENHTLVLSINAKNSNGCGCFALVKGYAVRFSVKNTQSAIIKSLEYGISDNHYVDIINCVNNTEENYSEGIGTAIEPDGKFERKYIPSNGILTDIDDDKFSVLRYNAESLPSKVILKGYAGYSTIENTIVMVTDIDNIWDGLNYIKKHQDKPKYFSIKIEIPKGCKNIYIGRISNADTGLNKAQLFTAVNGNDVYSGYDNIELLKNIPSSYINDKGVITSLGNTSFSIDVYDVSQYKGKKVIINGKVGAAASMAKYAFSDNLINIYSTQNFEKTKAGEKYEFAMQEVEVPLQANYLFINRYTANGEFNVYKIVYSGIKEVVSNNKKNLDFLTEGYKILDSDVIVCPIYGQSLAVGGEAYPHITKMIKYKGLQITESMDDIPLTNSDNIELPFYGLQEGLISSYCNDKNIDYSQIKTKVCSFCTGLGSTSIVKFQKGEERYNILINKIQQAYNNAIAKGYKTIKVPAVVYVQGEADLPQTHTKQYKELLIQLQNDLNNEIKAITGQTENIPIVLYQTNQIDLGTAVNPNEFEPVKAVVPRSQMQLIRDNNTFVASTPIYWMDFYEEYIHITGYWQKVAGYFYGNAIYNYLEGRSTKGVMPIKIESSENDVVLTYNVPSLPLVVDTDTVNKVDNYGYNVVKSDNTSILESVEVKRDKVILHCSESPVGCKARYGFNGETDKSGWEKGARGNIRDSGYLFVDADGKILSAHNWAYMFDELIEE